VKRPTRPAAAAGGQESHGSPSPATEALLTLVTPHRAGRRRHPRKRRAETRLSLRFDDHPPSSPEEKFSCAPSSDERRNRHFGTIRSAIGGDPLSAWRPPAASVPTPQFADRPCISWFLGRIFGLCHICPSPGKRSRYRRHRLLSQRTGTLSKKIKAIDASPIKSASRAHNVLWFDGSFVSLVNAAVLATRPFWRSLGWKKIKSDPAGGQGRPWICISFGLRPSIFVVIDSSRSRTRTTAHPGVFKNTHWGAFLVMAMAVLVAAPVEETHLSR